MKQDNAYKGISWDLVINSIILYFLIEASEYIHPTISAKKKKKKSREKQMLLTANARLMEGTLLKAITTGMMSRAANSMVAVVMDWVSAD